MQGLFEAHVSDNRADAGQSAAAADSVPVEDFAVRRAAKVDENHAEVVAAFRQLGATVLDLSRVGQGCPDLLVGVAKNMALCEVKRNAKAKYTPAQLDFLTWWNGSPVFRIESLEHVAQAVAKLRDV